MINHVVNDDDDYGDDDDDYADHGAVVGNGCSCGNALIFLIGDSEFRNGSRYCNKY